MQNPTKEEIQHILKKAKVIAVVGLSDKPDRTSYRVSQIMQQAGYKIIPVNPNADEILGEKAVKRLTDIEEHVDIVNVFRRSEFLPEIAEAFDQIDADVFWAQLGIANQEAFDFLAEKGYPTVMDYCIKVAYQEMD
ncbi:CoA-binding protein [Listeria monocytogenes]|uniref:CoA-binding protein n=1 Tax=Listeria monocytogenes TaxID=1639 RepID=UPI0001B43262|nr:CoA-binding protein [Listeria monocytogenes]EAC6872669.1 CoA-binding protein [Listeria monocytogenes]EAD1933783.1 CoA-binding protein [Listeria monocytogenes]EAE5920599.1 CoA-binding protein [Listeria monocytogenes]EAF5830914.1 CoA-binding protein [Listeria monocytogenes]EAG6689043.1 CoA-binding protein [Listeria monocytogenes]